MEFLLEPFQLPFVQRGLLEVLILAVPAGLLGTWIVLRGLAFFSHAVGTAAFPGLVLADGLGFAAPLGAFGGGARLHRRHAALGRGRERGRDSVVALVLVGCLAGGRDPRQRRLRLRRQRRDAAVRQPAADRRRRHRPAAAVAAVATLVGDAAARRALAGRRASIPRAGRRRQAPRCWTRRCWA